MAANKADRLSRKRLFLYGIVGLPIAMGGLPLFVHIPPIYSGLYGIPMTSLAIILVLVRALDALVDPILGHYSDHWGHSIYSKARLTAIGIVGLAIGLWGFLIPLPDTYLTWGFSAILAFCAIAYSFALINALSVGSALSSDYSEQNRINAWREGFSLLAVLIASALPMWLSNENNPQSTMMWFAICAGVSAVIALSLMFRGLGRNRTYATRQDRPISLLFEPFKHHEARWLFGIALINAVASATPATLVIFYIRDVLEAFALSGLFLGVYFAVGAASIPFWLWLSHHIGKKRSWMASMVISVISFAFAASLGAGDIAGFIIICSATGFTLGADLIFAPSILGDVLNRIDDNSRRPSLVFSLWNFMNKAALTLAAALSLPLLAYVGYEPSGAADVGAIRALALTYALLPCGFKLVAFCLLAISPLDNIFDEEIRHEAN